AERLSGQLGDVPAVPPRHRLAQLVPLERIGRTEACDRAPGRVERLDHDSSAAPGLEVELQPIARGKERNGRERAAVRARVGRDEGVELPGCETDASGVPGEPAGTLLPVEAGRPVRVVRSAVVEADLVADAQRARLRDEQAFVPLTLAPARDGG